MKHPFLTLVLALLASAAALPGNGAGTVKLLRGEDRVRVEINGRLFTEYIYHGAYRPYCHPVLAADGTGLTRDFPMRKAPGEDEDHPHHRSLWFAHSDVNGVDFWNQDNVGSPRPKGKIMHEDLIETADGSVGVLRARNRWVAPDGRVFCTDDRTLRFGVIGIDRFIDFDVTLRAPADAPVHLNDDKDGVLALRLATWMNQPRPPTSRRKFTSGTGVLITSRGDRNGPAWGKRGEWADYHASRNGKTYGVAIFDHPQNLNHPTWWHARDYGLFAANPLGQQDFEPQKAREVAGVHVIPAGGSLRLRYRVLLHAGDEKTARVAERYAEYSRSK